jgi:hypothetical protein
LELNALLNGELEKSIPNPKKNFLLPKKALLKTPAMNYHPQHGGRHHQ